eukprot:4308965-Ditylum_brightwellii.AAC.1
MMPLNTRSNAICDWRGRLRVLLDKFMQQALRTMTYRSKISLSVKEKVKMQHSQSSSSIFRLQPSYTPPPKPTEIIVPLKERVMMSIALEVSSTKYSAEGTPCKLT